MAKRKGFLLIEAVFSIFITFLCVLVLQGLMKNLLNLKKYQSNANEIAFSYVQLEQFFNEKNTITYALPEKSTSFKAVLCREKDGQKLSLNLLYNRIRESLQGNLEQVLLRNKKKNK